MTDSLVVQVVRTDDPLEMEGDVLARTVGEGLEGVTAFSRRVGQVAGPEVAERLRAMGETPVGAALLTPGGGLRTDFLLHLVIRSLDESVSQSGVDRALRNALRQAEGWGLQHLILPPVGIGAGNLTPETAARRLAEALRGHAQGASAPSRVTIPVSSDYEAELFRSELARVFPEEGQG